MKAKMCFHHRLISSVSTLLTGVVSLIAQAEQDFLPQTQLRTPYSSDIAIIDQYSAPTIQYQIRVSDREILRNYPEIKSGFRMLFPSLYKATAPKHREVISGKILSNIRTSPSSFQDKTGTTIYRAMTISQKTLQRKIASAALIYGIEYFGYATPLKDSMNFIKQKTRYSFGDCGQIRFSTKRLKAQSCITDQTKIEFKSSYKLDSFTLDFKWAL